jgi:hypothetical protein
MVDPMRQSQEPRRDRATGPIHAGFYADLMVEDQAIVEIKAVKTVAPVHKKLALIKNGITRTVKGLKE